MASSRALSLLFSPSSRFNLVKKYSPLPSLFSSSYSTRYPLCYELISYRPARSPRASLHRRKSQREQPENPDSDTGIDDFADTELEKEIPFSKKASNSEEMDKSMRKYYRKRRKMMYGSDSDDENRPGEDKYIELKPEIFDFPRLHPREEELYFYDTFAFPWEKNKHYRMMYQLEKKYFPDQCLDKAFMPEEPQKENKTSRAAAKKEKKEKGGGVGEGIGVGVGGDEKGLVFFEEESVAREKGSSEDVSVTDKKVEEFFKCLKKVPSAGEDPSGELYISTRKTGLPPRWDGRHGAVVMVNKPKG